MIDAFSQHGIVARALTRGLFALTALDLRDFATDNYRRIDAKTYGGGPGMVMTIAPLEAALAKAKAEQKSAGINQPVVIYLSPQGQPVKQPLLNQLAQQRGIIFVCGRYEGVDERFIQRNVDLELSIGDFVVSGGELPALLLIDALVRQLPGSVKQHESISNDSFMHGLLDYPHYTAPRDYQGVKVPEILASGNHEQIKRWRLQQSLWRTYQRRPDLLQQRNLTKEESRLLAELGVDLTAIALKTT